MNTNIKCAVFDLDGTLVNTITDLGNACNYVLKLHGYPLKWNEEDYKRFVGNGMRVLIDRAYEHTLSPDALESVLKEFKQYYAATMMTHTAIYPGVREQLERMKQYGIKLAVVTNKAHEAAVALLDTLFGKDFFDSIVGQQEELPPKPNPTAVLRALAEMDCDPADAIYYGDSDVDMITAKNAGITAVGVTWGYRSKDNLLSVGADKIIDETKYISTTAINLTCPH
ncbi:MAG: HAD-IA family hydrolase [Eubacterium sp.]|nr:HAD-IA family hydrolase [Eubacterium sp.]